jgi:hypothetical protein
MACCLPGEAFGAQTDMGVCSKQSALPSRLRHSRLCSRRAPFKFATELDSMKVAKLLRFPIANESMSPLYSRRRTPQQPVAEVQIAEKHPSVAKARRLLSNICGTTIDPARKQLHRIPIHFRKNAEMDGAP